MAARNPTQELDSIFPRISKCASTSIRLQEAQCNHFGFYLVCLSRCGQDCFRFSGMDRQHRIKVRRFTVTHKSREVEATSCT